MKNMTTLQSGKSIAVYETFKWPSMKHSTLQKVVLTTMALVASLALSAQAGRRPTMTSENQSKPSILSPSDVMAPLAPHFPQVILYDQYNNAGAGLTPSDTFTDFSMSDADLADDFVVPAGQTWNVESIDADGVYWEGFGPANSFNVFIYTDNAGLPGTQIFSTTNQPWAQSGTTFTVTLSPAAVLSPGTYWIEIQANMTFDVGGWWSWTSRTVQSNQGAAWQSPGGGWFDIFCPTWSRKADCWGGLPDQVYRINGTIGGCLSPPAGLVSWWSGDRTADDLQGANPGRLIGGTAFKKGMVRSGFLLDGIDDWVRVANSSSLTLTRVTLDAWLYMTGNENLSRRLIGKDNVSTSREYSLGVNDHNMVEGFVVVPSGIKVATGVTETKLNTWYHLAMTYDGAKLRLYIDGVQDAEADVVGDIVPTTSSLGIGGDAFGEFTKGVVDEAQVFNRALNETEILAIYQAGASGQCKPEIFVSSIIPSYAVAHSKYLVSTSVAVEDTNGIGVSGATANVKTLFPDGSELTFPLTTDENGTASFSFYTSETGLYKFKVIDVSLPGREYNASLNIETTDTLVIP
jgi:Concanavalin A-like lectin/glucanases superfamily